MNALDILKYGHQTVLTTIDGLPEEAWETPNVVGVWSSKDIIAHLTSFERVLTEVLGSLLGEGQPTPTLDRFCSQETFNHDEVARRKDKTPEEVLAEYSAAHARATSLATRLSAETFRQASTLPWYGADYALDDLIVYMFYGHKREHSAQVSLFRKRSAPARGVRG